MVANQRLGLSNHVPFLILSPAWRGNLWPLLHPLMTPWAVCSWGRLQDQSKIQKKMILGEAPTTGRADGGQRLLARTFRRHHWGERRGRALHCGEEDDEDLMCIEEWRKRGGLSGSWRHRSRANPAGCYFRWKNTIIRTHAEAHLSETGSCQVCGASFSERAAAVTHALTHVGILLFSCDVCEHQFRTESALIHHRRQSAAKCAPQNPDQTERSLPRQGGNCSAPSVLNPWRMILRLVEKFFSLCIHLIHVLTLTRSQLRKLKVRPKSCAYALFCDVF